MTTLVIVPCGARKIWMKEPDIGAVAAQDVYISPTFKINRQYAERFGDRWVILSAKYGFIAPEFVIPEAYDVTFLNPKTNPISRRELEQQAADQGLAAFDQIIGLGGKEYRNAMQAAFPDHSGIVFPFAGLQQGYMNQATKRATMQGVPIPKRATNQS